MILNRPQRDGLGNLNGASLLVVEDDYLLLVELEMVLREAGAGDVRACRSVEEALATIETAPVAAAVLDIRIGQDSIEPVAQALAAHGTPFVFYTGQAQGEQVLAKWPSCRMISKPAVPATIIDAVAEMLPTAP